MLLLSRAFAMRFGHRFGFEHHRKAWRGAGVLTLPLGHPGDFPRGLGSLAGVPTCTKCWASPDALVAE